MNGTTRFFLQELARIRENCRGLKQGLDGEDLNDPIHAGEVDQLEIELGHYAQVVDLIASAHTAVDAQAEMRMRYLRAQRAHQRCTLTRPAAECDQWWATLGEMQYMSALYTEFQTWLKAHPRTEVDREDGEKVRVEDLRRECDKLNAFAAHAKAHLSAAARSRLVRHDPELPPPNGRGRYGPR
ncbi:MAG: hypothetical protein JW910_03330 [Anaerolineae bacterium]|nr:hypothetical protein [Anaerolineae bacterium]